MNKEFQIEYLFLVMFISFVVTSIAYIENNIIKQMSNLQCQGVYCYEGNY